MSGTLESEFDRLRARSIVIERKDLKAAQDLPDGFVIVGATGRREMCANGRDERPHIFVADLLAVDPLGERRGRADLASPAEHVLIWPGDLERRALGRDGELVPIMPQVELGIRCGKLRHDVLEHRVAGRERDGPLHLDFEYRRHARVGDAAHDHVVERVPFPRALKLNPIHQYAGQAARISLGEHGQQIMRPDLSLEEGACRAARGRARRGRFALRLVSRHHLPAAGRNG